MNTIAKAVIVLAMAGAVIAPQAVSGENLLRTRVSDASNFHNFLPLLPGDVPWLAPVRWTPLKGPRLPEAGSVRALVLDVKPAEQWAPLMSRPVALCSATCQQC